MISLKSNKSGFTIVELLIVIVVIGILAGLVLTTFAGVQKKARDSERKTDVQTTASHLEVYASQNGSKYPTLANLQSDAFAASDLEGLDIESLRAPDEAANTIVGAGAAIDNYQYVVTPAGCDNTDTGGDCTDFVLTATLEAGGTYVKNGLLN